MSTTDITGNSEVSTSRSGGVMRTADGTPLKVSLARALRRQKLRAFLLIAPLLAFILFSFLFPIGSMLFRSVENNIVGDTLPKTVVALRDWDPATGSLPDEKVFAAFHADMVQAFEDKTHTKVGLRLNYDEPGMSGLFRKTGSKAKRMEAPYAEAFKAVDESWAKIDTWKVIKRLSPRVTDSYFLASVDLKRTARGDIERVPENERLYIFLFERTLFLSLVITGTCLLLGFPIAYLLAHLPMRISNMLLILILLPFWTSLLVRTSAWKVLLQQQGVVNDILVWIGLVADDSRLQMMNNQFATIVAMTHILMPFMILPLYSVMQTISPTYVRAAKSLGATDWTAFWRVYFPQTIPGIGAGAILVFILAIGYYITPELVGGTSGVFISNRIAYHISASLNWGLAAALGSILLIMVVLLFYVYDKLVGIDNVKLG